MRIPLATTKKETKKRRKQTQKQCAVFTYDIFPYMVVHDVMEWTDDGDIMFERGFYRQGDSLIAVFPKKMEPHIER